MPKKKEETVKTIKPEKYVMREGYTAILTDKVKAFLVYNVKNGRMFYDIVVDLDGRLFLVKPWQLYSQKSINVYNWYVRDLAVLALSKQ